MALVATAMIVADAEAFRVTTADPGGADCELRESSATSNRGTSTEIASRIDNREESYYKRNSLIYLKFGVENISAADLLGDITIRTSYRNTNLSAGRIEDTAGLNGGENTGFDYFVLNPTAAGADWDELTIAPTTDAVAGTVQAPGYYYDGDLGTKAHTDPIFGLHPDLTYLGFNQFDSADLVGSSPHLPVGGAFNFTLSAGSALHLAIAEAQATDHQTVTIIMSIAHDAVGVDTNWLGFNYLFNPKEMTTLNNDADSPWGGWSNDLHIFSPMLTNVPEPATMVLLGLGGLLLRRKR